MVSPAIILDKIGFVDSSMELIHPLLHLVQTILSLKDDAWPGRFVIVCFATKLDLCFLVLCSTRCVPPGCFRRAFAQFGQKCSLLSGVHPQNMHPLTGDWGFLAMSDKQSKDEELSGPEVDQRSKETLARLLAMPPQPKPKKDASANPKKRGRPAKEKPA